MRGIGRTISRLSAAGAFLAGAAFLAVASLPARAEAPRSNHGSEEAIAPDETAMVMPRISPPAGASGLNLPQPLAPSDAARIKRIFALQRRGAFTEAAADTARLTDDTLLGHVLADRALRRPALLTRAALVDWLGRYADLPDAQAIYDLLLRKLPRGSVRPPAPPMASLASMTKSVAITQHMDGAAEAREALVAGHNAAAQRLGTDTWIRSGGGTPDAAFVAGLAAWQRGLFSAAAGLFEAASLSDTAGASLRAAAAFWAARAHLRGGHPAAWEPWMLRAAAEPHTLHGILARRALVLPAPTTPEVPLLAQADLDAVADTPQGRRAFALIQVNEPARAEAELRRLWPLAQSRPPLARALFMVAGAAGFAPLLDDLSELVNTAWIDVPSPVLKPRGGFRLNRALVYAVTRVESNFDPHAVSGEGALGLMQLMPAEAGGPSALSANMLREPGINLKLGQEYLAALSQRGMAGDDLLRVLASYNAGPGNVQRWTDQGNGDPLMFLETIPNDETRHFVARTLTYMGAYAARFGLASPGLDALASGAWPRFSPEVSRARPH